MSNVVGASLSEPHTREFGAEISVCLLACLYACIRRTSRAKCRSKCSRVHGRTTADSKAAFTRAPGPESGFESGSQSTWERWSESGFESSLPPCKRNQSGSGSGSECPCKRGSSQQVTGSIPGNDMLFFSSKIFLLQCTRMRVNCQCKIPLLALQDLYEVRP